jgi:hypothetical protein
MNPHFVYKFLLWVRDNQDLAQVPDGPLTEFSIAINEDKKCRALPNFDSLSAVEKYRAYYRLDKEFAVWKNAERPEWMSL